MTKIITAAQYRTLMTEAEMQSTVTGLVDRRGGRLFHIRRSDTAPEMKDLPDWLIVDPMSARVLLVEAKSQRRKVTDGQHQLLQMLACCTRFSSGIVRPDPRDGEMAYETFVGWLADLKR